MPFGLEIVKLLPSWTPFVLHPAEILFGLYFAWRFYSSGWKMTALAGLFYALSGVAGLLSHLDVLDDKFTSVSRLILVFISFVLLFTELSQKAGKK